jgi:hypothetical protein
LHGGKLRLQLDKDCTDPCSTRTSRAKRQIMASSHHCPQGAHTTHPHTAVDNIVDPPGRELPWQGRT